MRDLIEQQLPELMPVYNKEFSGRNMTILGSFKGWDKIKEYRKRFQELGYWVLAPQGEDIVDYAGSFEVLDTDVTKVQRLTEHLGRSPTKQEVGTFIETLFLQAIDISDFTYVVGLDRKLDDGTYIGQQVAGEIGYTAGQLIPVFSDGQISPTLDEREGWTTMFPGYIEIMVQLAAPEKVQFELEAHNLGAYPS
jgi:hypothetical protein